MTDNVMHEKQLILAELNPLKYQLHNGIQSPSIPVMETKGLCLYHRLLCLCIWDTGIKACWQGEWECEPP